MTAGGDRTKENFIFKTWNIRVCLLRCKREKRGRKGGRGRWGGERQKDFEDKAEKNYVLIVIFEEPRRKLNS
jgi:hypothetical protein